MNEQTRKALKNPETWLRLPVMVLFFVMLMIATPLLIVVSLYAWVVLLVTGGWPESVLRYGKDIGAWFERASRYLTGAADRRPFPFEDLDCPRDPAPVPVTRVASPNPAQEIPAAAAPASDDRGVKDRSDSDRSAKPAGDQGKSPSSEASDSKKAGKKASKKKTAAKKKARSKKAGAKKSAGKKAGGKKQATKKSAQKKAGAARAEKEASKEGADPQAPQSPDAPN